MASAITNTGQSSAANATTSSTTTKSTNPNDQLANKETFLKLLVAQIKNQDPTNPTDGVQFLTQLAQFSSLEQSMQSNATLESIRQAVVNLAPSSGNSGSSSGSGTQASDRTAVTKS